MEVVSHLLCGFVEYLSLIGQLRHSAAYQMLHLQNYSKRNGNKTNKQSHPVLTDVYVTLLCMP